MNPLVGITAWKRTLDTFYGPESMQTLSAYYTDSVYGAGMTPVIFPAALDPREAESLVGLVDGLLLSGGDDIDPTTYGAENTDSRNANRAVDVLELALAREAKLQGKPVLAICRGLQLLNVALGGTLNQEVTSEGGVHELISRDHVEMNARRHVVRFEDGSIIAETYGSSEAKVNTLHHQGVGTLAGDLVVEGRTDDGLVEAARYDGDWWALGVQWHPERMDGPHLKIFDLLREAIETG
ncbi:MAG: gamma-glutamyl-gamma-aminobutyrate hydrolase family protein [Acidimicrobiia bacterium]|jgi:putative glutamine amidotransferase